VASDHQVDLMTIWITTRLLISRRESMRNLHVKLQRLLRTRKNKT
jgi:hypothetical protein